jgi:hypothetical protein
MKHYQYRCKCLRCSLHFIICSDYDDYTKRISKVKCPECGGTGQKLVYKSTVEKPIYMVVPGANTEFVQVIGDDVD